MTEMTFTRCPRCEAAGIINGHGALSRTTRDEEGAPVMVCDRCGERESLCGYDPADQAPLSDWPLSFERLLAEEAELIRRFRESTLGLLSVDEMEPS